MWNMSFWYMLYCTCIFIALHLAKSFLGCLPFAPDFFVLTNRLVFFCVFLTKLLVVGLFSLVSLFSIHFVDVFPCAERPLRKFLMCPGFPGFGVVLIVFIVCSYDVFVRFWHLETTFLNTALSVQSVFCHRT